MNFVDLNWSQFIMRSQRVLVCLSLLLDEILTFIVVSATDSYKLSSGMSELKDSEQPCNFTGVSLFCRDSTSEVDVDVCYYCAGGSAVCGTIPNYAMECRFGSVYIRECYCLTYDYNTQVLNVGNCLYNCQKGENKGIHGGYDVLPTDISQVNSTMCGKWHRDRALCGRCQDGYFPMAYSYNMTCVKCHHQANWLKLALFVLVPLTAFCFLVIIFNISITSSNLHGFVLFAQALSIPAMSRVIFLSYEGKESHLFFIKLLGCFYSIWSLDILRSFSPGFCLHIKSLDTLMLDMAIGMYPLILILISHWSIALYDRKCKVLQILWKPFRKLLGYFHQRWDFKTSIIDSFATFLILSNVKFMSACFDMLAPVNVYNITSGGDITHGYGLFYDGSTMLHKTTTRILVACVVLLIFTIFPIFILFLYPFKFFQNFLNRMPVRWHGLRTFADPFQGCYKNGTSQETRDFRWFSSMFLFSRLLFFLYICGNLIFSFLLLCYDVGSAIDITCSHF